MPDVEADDRTIDIKQKLRAAIAQSLPDGTYDDAVYAWIHALLGELTPRTPTPRPIDRQHFIGSPWGN